MSGFKRVPAVKPLAAASKALFAKVLKMITNTPLQEGMYALGRSTFTWKDLISKGKRAE